MFSFGLNALRCAFLAVLRVHTGGLLKNMQLAAVYDSECILSE